MKLRKRYLVLIVLVITILVGYLSLQFLFPESRNIAQEKPDYKITARKLQEDMSSPTLSSKYIDKVVELKGQVTEIAPNYIMLDNKIQISLLHPEKHSLNLGESITIKGRCVGYDDLLEEVKLDQATTIEVE